MANTINLVRRVLVRRAFSRGPHLLRPPPRPDLQSYSALSDCLLSYSHLACGIISVIEHVQFQGGFCRAAPRERPWQRVDMRHPTGRSAAARCHTPAKLPVPTVGRRSERSRTPFRRSPFGTVAERLLHSGTAVTLVERLLVTSVTSVTTFARNRIHAIHILWQLNSARSSCTPISDPYSRATLTLHCALQLNRAVQQNNSYTYIAHYTRPCMASHAHASIPTAAAASFAVAALFSASKVKQGQRWAAEARLCRPKVRHHKIRTA